MRADLFDRIAVYGSELTVLSAETPAGRRGRGFIRPATVSGDDGVFTPTSAGASDRRRFLLIASPECVQSGETRLKVHCGGYEYIVLRIEPIGDPNAPNHWEAVLRFRGEVEENA